MIGLIAAVGAAMGAAASAMGAEGLEQHPANGLDEMAPARALELVNSYTAIFLVAFLTTLLSTPVVRRLAIRLNIIDKPDQVRKLHEFPVAYLGGIAVFLGVLAAIALSYVWFDGTTARYDTVPLAVVVGMVVITLTGLADDVWKWNPRLKIAGQLVAAAILAVDNIGVRVAAGVLSPLAPMLDPILGTEKLIWTLPMSIPLLGNQIDIIYWTGTALIAVAVLGACNAANLIDGLDGLLAGTTSIMAVGFIAISILMVLTVSSATGTTPLSGARLVLCFALLGATLGFLPHNFNPAAIFLGDCGSLLIGYLCIVIVLMFGEDGQTSLVFAGLIVFALPIMDTTLAIIRRILAGVSLSQGDDQHIHHQLKRTLGTVKRAVFALYGITAAFAILGVTLAALVVLTDLRVRVLYACAVVLFGFIGAMGVKAARREQIRRSVAKALGDRS